MGGAGENAASSLSGRGSWGSDHADRARRALPWRHDSVSIHTVCMKATVKQAARSAATRQALVSAARKLFAQRGFADVGTEEIVRAAGVTRGALYHHFADKSELFAATFVEVEVDTNARIAASATGEQDPIAAMRLGARAFLDV